MYRLIRLLVLTPFLLVSGLSTAQVTLPAIIGDNMVLQQKSVAPLWGWATGGQTVIVTSSWNNETVRTKADHNGRWQVEVHTPNAGGPFSITIKSKNEIILTNVMIGEVWLCSGQSNMEMPLRGWPGQPVAGSDRAIASADYPDIRLFTVKRKVSYEPLDDCEGQWASCSPDNAGDFSAAGFFFGVDLYKKLKIPIGLIHSSWGGTPAEAWTSKEYIEKIPYFQTSDGKCDAREFRAKKMKAQEVFQEARFKELGMSIASEAPEWGSADYDDSDWQDIAVPATWGDTEIGDFQGVIQFRKVFKALRGWTKKAVVLDLGPIDEMDVVWVNGVQLGRHLSASDWSVFRSYDIPLGVLKKGENILAVQVANTYGIGGINGKPESLRVHAKGKKMIYESLSGRWKYKKVKSLKDPDPLPQCINCAEPQTPTTLYNGMIAPLIPFKIKGAIWYQGESNRYDGKLYGRIFPNMIENWRNDWGQGDFSFYYVQIAPYTYRDDFSTGLLREAQFNTLKTKNTGMVVTMDIGSLTTIHPPDKRSIGIRLSSWALVKDYGFKNMYYSGPLYQSYTVEGDKIRIHFSYTCGGLVAQGGELKHFEIAGQDGNYVPAKAVIEKNTVLVYGESILHPVAVRFGWGSTDVTNLFNAARLPASPFRTKADE